jgi:hypothetical protein
MAYKDLEKERACKRRWYQNNREVYLTRNKRKKEVLRNVMRDHKSKPCADCSGEFPYYVMDFDHREDETKTAHVSRMIEKMSLQKLLEEIEKCDVVCANCHRIRTFQRNQQFSGIV